MLLSAAENIEKDLRRKYRTLGGYFDNVFPWVQNMAKKETDRFLKLAADKKVPPAAVIYALLFLQISEQIKAGGFRGGKGTLNQQGKEMYTLWKDLLEKLEYHKYLPAADLAARRQEMADWIKTNG